ncbi:MAG: hypothetical protein U5L04_13810 [Trueperaceae bacterium]|nr:hypothetical protein [Trueperaceae bacterium]
MTINAAVYHEKRLVRAEPHLTRTYQAYTASPDLAVALNQDAALRFSALETKRVILPQDVTRSVVDLMQQITASRNLPQF